MPESNLNLTQAHQDPLPSFCQVGYYGIINQNDPAAMTNDMQETACQSHYQQSRALAQETSIFSHTDNINQAQPIGDWQPNGTLMATNPSYDLQPQFPQTGYCNQNPPAMNGTPNLLLKEDHMKQNQVIEPKPESGGHCQNQTMPNNENPTELFTERVIGTWESGPTFTSASMNHRHGPFPNIQKLPTSQVSFGQSNRNQFKAETENANNKHFLESSKSHSCKIFHFFSVATLECDRPFRNFCLGHAVAKQHILSIWLGSSIRTLAFRLVLRVIWALHIRPLEKVKVS